MLSAWHISRTQCALAVFGAGLWLLALAPSANAQAQVIHGKRGVTIQHAVVNFAELARQEGRKLGDVISELPGAAVIRGQNSRGWVFSSRNEPCAWPSLPTCRAMRNVYFPENAVICQLTVMTNGALDFSLRRQ